MELVCYHCRYVLLTSRFLSLYVTFDRVVVKLVVASELENERHSVVFELRSL